MKIISNGLAVGLAAFAVFLMVGCSHGLQEVGFAIPDTKDGVHHIVTRDVVNSRLTANQPHATGQFHCTGKYTSIEMATLRAKYGEHTWFKGCTPTVDMPQHKYAVTSDQSWVSAFQGVIASAILGGSLVGMAALWPEDNIVQNGGSTSSSATGGRASATGGSVKQYGPYRGGYGHRW